MKKSKIILIIIIIILIQLCVSCSNSKDISIIEMPGVTAVGIDDAIDRDFDTTLISSLDEYNIFLSLDRMVTANTNFLSKLEQYDSEEYFDHYYLIVIFIEFTTTGPEPSVSSIEYSDMNIYISLLMTDNGTTGERVTPWAILIKYSKTDEISRINVSFDD